MSHQIPSKMLPFVGNFDLTSDGKEEILNCMPEAGDTDAVVRDKLSKLATYVYILMDSTYCEGNEDGRPKDIR